MGIKQGAVRSDAINYERYNKMNDDRKLLILDLDETLIYASEQQLEQAPAFRFGNYFVYKRSHLDTFLNNIYTHYRIGIWSSADDDYVTEIVKLLIPATVRLEFVWGRSKCTVRHNPIYDHYYFEKRLDKLKKLGFKLEQMVIVDDSPEKTRNNYGNAVYIREFTGSDNDHELLFLNDYLLALKDVVNIRNVEKRGWRTAYDIAEQKRN